MTDNEYVPPKIPRAPMKIEQAVGTLTDPRVTDEELGRYVRDYLKASHYDNDWEGFGGDDLCGIRELLSDMALGLAAIYNRST